MTAESKSYENVSDATHRHDAKWTSRLNEAQFLANERADAQQAMNDALDDLKSSLGQAADVRLWAKEHPWATVGVALVGGFAAAAAITPRRDESLGEHLSGVAGRVRGKRRDDDAEVDVKRAGIMSGLFDKLFDMAKLAIGNFIMLQIQSRMAAYSDQQPTDDGSPEHADSTTAATD